MKIFRTALCFALLFGCACGNKRERVKPTVGSITEAVYASAEIKAGDQYEVFSTVSGLLAGIRVRPGQKVEAGQVLFALDDNVASLNTESSRIALELSRENSRKNSEKLQEMKLNLRLAAERYRLDSMLYKRQKNLWDQRIGSQLELDQRRMAYISSRNSYQTVGVQLAQLQTTLRNDLKKSRVNYDISRAMESDFLIGSKIRGTVFNILKDEGELVTPQSPLAVIGRSNEFITEMRVDENDITRVRPGQLVLITLDSYRRRVFEGRITKIYPLMDESSRTFKVEASFADPPETLYPNLSAEANIIISRKKKAIVIPRRFLDSNRYVWTGRNQKKEVVTGLKDYSKVEILRGIDTSAFIYMPK